MAINTTPVSAEAFHPYPDSADNTPYGATADAGDFFSTLLDIINPLQHIPLVSNLYRELTGDEIEPAARLVGGAVFGGPIGFASATANVLIEQASGDDVLGHTLALFSDAPAELTAPGDTELLAQAPARVAPATQTTGESRATAGDSTPETGLDDIVWHGARALPVRAPLDNVVLKQLVAEQSMASDEDLPPPDDTAPQPSGWLNRSHDAAQLAQAARAAGEPAPQQPARPWVANAMFEALDKYEALARARAGKTGENSGS